MVNRKKKQEKTNSSVIDEVHGRKDVKSGGKCVRGRCSKFKMFAKVQAAAQESSSSANYRSKGGVAEDAESHFNR